jgi:acyl-CoA synthetase (AMP-forming)/AMP-acid ligase II
LHSPKSRRKGQIGGEGCHRGCRKEAFKGAPVLSKPTFNATTVADYLHRYKQFKVPVKVWITDAIPKGATGKISRKNVSATFIEKAKKEGSAKL